MIIFFAALLLLATAALVRTLMRADGNDTRSSRTRLVLAPLPDPNPVPSPPPLPAFAGKTDAFAPAPAAAAETADDDAFAWVTPVAAAAPPPAPVPDRSIRFFCAEDMVDPVDGAALLPHEPTATCACGVRYRAASVQWLAEYLEGTCLQCGAAVCEPVALVGA